MQEAQIDEQIDQRRFRSSRRNNLAGQRQGDDKADDGCMRTCSGVEAAGMIHIYYSI